MAGNNELKPNKKVFVNFRFAEGFIISLTFFAIFYFAISHLTEISALIPALYLYFIVVFVLVQLISYYSLTVRYRKEKYIFFPDKIIHKSGGIFSDSETELIIRNITHVTLRLPFIENRLFRTGSISIESAGSGGVEVYLQKMNKPKEAYEYIQKIMKHNGFRLRKTKLIQRERPSSLGVFFEVLGTFFGILFIILWLISIAFKEGGSVLLDFFNLTSPLPPNLML